jgi:hypothetical protein
MFVHGLHCAAHLNPLSSSLPQPGLYSPSCRELSFSETHIQPSGCLCVRTGAERSFCKRLQNSSSHLATRLDRYSLLDSGSVSIRGNYRVPVSKAKFSNVLTTGLRSQACFEERSPYLANFPASMGSPLSRCSRNSANSSFI